MARGGVESRLKSGLPPYQSDMLPLEHRAEIGVARIELRCLVLPTHAGHHYPSPRKSQNGRIRTGGLLAPDQADFQALPRSEFQIARRGIEPRPPP